MRLTHILVPCTDAARSLVFYQTLGLTPIVVDHDADGTLSGARLLLPDGDATLSLERRATVSPGVVVYLECDDLDVRVASLRAAGIVVGTGPETKPSLWREATLVDPDGHTLCLFQAGRYRRDPPWRLPTSVLPGEADRDVRDLEPLLAAHNRGYLDAPIPSARDTQIDAYLDGLASGAPAERDRAATALGPAYTSTLLAYAERMASLAVRAPSPRHAWHGVFAVALTWRACKDVRPAIVVLGLLYDAAKRAGAAPEAVFTEAAAVSPDDVAPVLRDFVTRPDLDEIAEEMGFSAARDRDGFRYRRTWGAGRLDEDDGV